MTRALDAAMLADIAAQSAEKTELFELHFELVNIPGPIPGPGGPTGYPGYPRGYSGGGASPPNMDPGRPG